MGEVVELDVVTSLNLPVERILRKAGEADLDGVVVIGWTKAGERYFSASYADGPEVLWLLKLAEKDLLAVGAGEHPSLMG